MVGSVLLLAVGAACPVAGQQVQRPLEGETAAPAPLFASHEVLTLNLEAPLASLRDDRGEDPPERDAVLMYFDGLGQPVRLDVQLRTRGHTRLLRQICDFPPLRVNFRRSQVEGTVFEGQNKLKLVTHCQDRQLEYQQYVLLEYLVYRAYGLFTEAGFRVRLAWITYLDPDTERDPYSRFAFFIEEEEDLAERNGWEVIKVERIHPYDLQAGQLRLFEVFQYLIGNTDWSVVARERGKTWCCHNARVIGNLAGVALPVPYDFDMAGIIDTRYATADTSLGIHSVRQRQFMGFCAPREELEAVFSLFNERREAVYAVFRDQAGLSERSVRRTMGYLDDFYDIINDPGAVTREMIEPCREL